MGRHGEGGQRLWAGEYPSDTSAEKVGKGRGGGVGGEGIVSISLIFIGLR